MANAVRLRVEPLISKVASPPQQGFLIHRSLLSIVVEIDTAMHLLGVELQHAAAVFFDFAAAFRSLNHEFLHETLIHLHLPRSLTNFIDNLYLGNDCSIRISRSSFERFSIRAGIRQGCPPFPFALCPLCGFPAPTAG